MNEDNTNHGTINVCAWMSERSALSHVEEARHDLRNSTGIMLANNTNDGVQHQYYDNEHYNYLNTMTNDAVGSSFPPAISNRREDLEGAAVLCKLTEKITDRIRNEVRGELTLMMKPHQTNITSKSADDKNIMETLNTHLEKYLSSELDTHTCPICYELMMPPSKTPVLLFPCGHSFCKDCEQQHSSRSKKMSKRKNGGYIVNCPFCRKVVVSTAENQALKSLIEKFAGQKIQVEELCCDGNNNTVEQNLKSIFHPVNSTKSLLSSSPRIRGNYPGDGRISNTFGGETPPPEITENSKARTTYITQYKNCLARHKILFDELEDLNQNMTGSRRKREGIDATMQTLNNEKQIVTHITYDFSRRKSWN